MERLTERWSESVVKLKGCSNVYANVERKRAHIQNAIVRLAVYEDSGLMPDEVMELLKIVRCNDCTHCTSLNLGGYICENKDAPWYREDDIVRVKLDDCCKYGLREKE